MILGILVLVAAMIFFTGILLVGKAIGVYNTGKVGQQDIKTQWSNILTEYQRRGDLIYNLVQAVKSYKNFEKETLTQVIAARGGVIQLPTMQKAQAMKKMSELNSLFQKLMVVFERYPKLQANEQHNELMKEVRITEDRINIARTDYNEIVGDYNKFVSTFPNNIFASMYKYSTEVFFVNESGTDKAPKIDLS